MKITVHTLLAGPDGIINPGQTVEMDDTRAQQLIAGGYASPEEDRPPARHPPARHPPRRRAAPTMETATAQPAPETTSAAAIETPALPRDNPDPAAAE